MRKIGAATTLLVVALFIVPLGAAFGSGSGGPTCPLPTAPGAVVVDISHELMTAWNADEATAGPVSVSLPAGSWDVYLTSYDDHSNKTHQAQSREQWQLQGWLGGTQVFTTATTPDLPETTDVEYFGVGSITTTSAIDQVVAVHAAYPDTLEPHSVAPLCAAFYPAGTAPMGELACPFPAADTVVSISTELMLAWDADSAMAGPVPFALPAGTYDLYLVSYDNHSAKSHQAQTQEQWYLEGWAGTSLVFASAATDDLAEDRDGDIYFVGSVTLNQAIDAVKAVHAAYPSDEPHSVAPFCAAFLPEGTSSSTSSTLPDGQTTPGETTTTTSGTQSGETTTTTSGTTTSGETTTTTAASSTTSGETTTTISSTTSGETTTTTSGSGTQTSDTTATTATSNTGGTTSTTAASATTGSSTATTSDTGRSDSQTGTSVAAGLEGNTAQSLQQLPLTGVELETAFAAIVAIMFGVVLLRRARSWQSRLDRRAARVWRRPIS